MISNIHKNRVGTISFDGKFSGMRKAQEFIVYPVKVGDKNISIQSDTRMGQINISNGELVMSKSHPSGANFVSLQLDILRKKTVKENIPTEHFQTLKDAIKLTSGPDVGGSIMKTDNSGAGAI